MSTTGLTGLDHLRALEAEAVFILREVVAEHVDTAAVDVAGAVEDVVAVLRAAWDD